MLVSETTTFKIQIENLFKELKLLYELKFYLNNNLYHQTNWASRSSELLF